MTSGAKKDNEKFIGSPLKKKLSSWSNKTQTYKIFKLNHKGRACDLEPTYVVQRIGKKENVSDHNRVIGCEIFVEVERNWDSSPGDHRRAKVRSQE